MTKCILHGGFERRDNELNNSFYRELVKDLPDHATLLMVYFASEYEGIREVFTEQTSRIHEITGKDMQFVLATEEDFLNQVEAADAIHFRGGHTPKLLATLKQYPELASELVGKTVSGSSAGAYALAQYGPGHSEKGIREGLGLVPVRVVCHYESIEMPPNPDSLNELIQMAPELELVQLRDCEWRVFN
jgi:peptidase E